MNRAMVTKFSPGKSVRPLDQAALEQLALAYVARFAVSSAKLRGYLLRKLRERGWAGEGEPPVEHLVERCVAAGYVDDAAYARGKDAGLLARGYGRRRIDQALMAAGIGGGLLGAAARRHLHAVAAWCLVLTGCVSIVRGAGFLDLGTEPPGCPLCAPQGDAAPTAAEPR